MDNTIFSFFTGSGLLDLGFEDENFQTVFVNEYFPPFMDAYDFSRRERKKSELFYGQSLDDIQVFANEKKDYLVEKVLDARKEGCTVGFIGGPPCPDFSVGGKNRGGKGENGRLSETYVEIIRLCKPDWFLFENVKGLWRTKKHRKFFDRLRRSLEKDFLLNTQMINAIETGVPQDRDRIFMFGVLKERNTTSSDLDFRSDLLYETPKVFDSYEWPDTEAFSPDSSTEKPAGIREELTVQHWFQKNDVANHMNQEHFFKPRAGLPRFQTIPEGDDSKKSFKRLHRWRYSPTAAYGNNEVHLHPYKPRRISVAESLAIQSMPAEFALPPEMTLTNMFKTVGNGVPYLLSRHVAHKVRSFL